jgi:hypothetical protein
LQKKAKQRLLSFMLRHGKHLSGKCHWTQAHYRWMIEEVKFDHPTQQLVSQKHIELVPSEHSTAIKKRGGITKTGIGYVQRLITESAWAYRHPARETRHLEQRAKRTTPAVQDIAMSTVQYIGRRTDNGGEMANAILETPRRRAARQ